MATLAKKVATSGATSSALRYAKNLNPGMARLSDMVVGKRSQINADKKIFSAHHVVPYSVLLLHVCGDINGDMTALYCPYLLVVVLLMDVDHQWCARCLLIMYLERGSRLINVFVILKVYEESWRERESTHTPCMRLHMPSLFLTRRNNTTSRRER